MNQTKLDQFLNLYRKHLARCVREKPAHYAWKPDQLPVVFDRMKQAIERGTFNKDSESLRATCRELGIRHTYTAIDAFLERGD